MNLSQIFKEAILEAKKEKPSAGLTKKQKSDFAKKAAAGKDIGKKGKGFEKIAAKAAKQYGSKEKGEKVAAAAMWKNIKRVKEANEKISGPLAELYDLVEKLIAQNITKDEILNVVNFATAKSGNSTTSSELNKIFEGEDHEVAMAKNSLESIMKSVADLMQKLGDDERNIPGWIQDHITNAENFIDQAAQGFHELEYHGDDEDDDEEEEGNPMIQPVDEKKLTKAEKAKKEEIIKAIAKKKGGKGKLKGKEYAIATAKAIKSAE